MNTILDIRLVKNVKILVDLIFGFFIIASTILGLLILAAPFLLNGSARQLTASVPVAIGAGEKPQFSVDVAGATAQGIQAAVVDMAQRTLRPETSNPWHIFISYASKLITAVGLAYIFYLLRAVLQSFLQGEVFTERNSTTIRRIGYMVLLVALLRTGTEYFAAEAILKQLVVIEPVLSLPSPFEAEVILASLLILILSHNWSYGLELERDRALTI